MGNAKGRFWYWMCTGQEALSRSGVLARVYARIYKASVHIVITILCWNWEGRVSHFYFNGIGDFKRGCAKRRVITCIPPKKISEGPASRFTILVFHSMRFYFKPSRTWRLNVKLTRARRRLEFFFSVFCSWSPIRDAIVSGTSAPM